MSGRLMMTSHSLPTTLLYRATVVSRPLAENNNLETYPTFFQIRPLVAACSAPRYLIAVPSCLR